MYCTQCGHELPDGSPKCEQCGLEAATREVPIAPTRFGIKTNKHLLPIIIGTGAVIILVLLAGTILKPATPEQVGTRFAKAFEQGKWANAYNYFDQDEMGNSNLVAFLDKENFISYAKSYSEARRGVKAAEFDPQEDANELNRKFWLMAGSPEDKHRYNADRYWEGNFTIYWNDGSCESMTLPLNNSNTKRPDWKVSPAPFIEERSIEAPEDVQVEVEGQLLDGDQLPWGRAYYRYRVFNGAEAKVKLSGQDMEPLEFTMVERTTQAAALKPSAKTIEQLEKACLQYIRSKSPQKEETWFGMHIYTFKDAKFEEPSFDSTLRKIYFPAVETWEMVTEGSDESEPNKQIKEYKLTYVLASADNGWKVVDRMAWYW